MGLCGVKVFLLTPCHLPKLLYLTGASWQSFSLTEMHSLCSLASSLVVAPAGQQACRLPSLLHGVSAWSLALGSPLDARGLPELQPLHMPAE